MENLWILCSCENLSAFVGSIAIFALCFHGHLQSEGKGKEKKEYAHEKILVSRVVFSID